MERADIEFRRAAIPDTLRHAALRLVQDGFTTLEYDDKARQLRTCDPKLESQYIQDSMEVALRGSAEPMITVVHVVDAERRYVSVLRAAPLLDLAQYTAELQADALAACMRAKLPVPRGISGMAVLTTLCSWLGAPNVKGLRVDGAVMGTSTKATKTLGDDAVSIQHANGDVLTLPLPLMIKCQQCVRFLEGLYSPSPQTLPSALEEWLMVAQAAQGYRSSPPQLP